MTRSSNQSGIDPDRGAAPPTNIDASGHKALQFARERGASGLRRTLTWQILRTVCRLGFAASIAVFAGEMIEGGTLSSTSLIGAIVGLILSSGAGYAAESQAAQAEADLVNGLRQNLEAALVAMPATRIRVRPAGSLIAGLQRQPPALAALVVSHAAARTMLTVGPLAAAAAIAVVSWQAALTLLCAIPIMVMFFVLLGSAVRSKAEAQEAAFGRLAAQFADRIRSLPTILANHALGHEHGKIERRMTAYADSTTGVLNTAFLNAGIIDFFSALAIAVLAIFLGLGHLGLVHVPGFTGLALWQSLFILVIAADFFTPFRRYAEQYHIKAEGQAAAKELDWYVAHADAADELDLFEPAGIEDFNVTALPQTGLIAISGPSGAGKSTMLRILAGIETRRAGLGVLPRVSAAGGDWMATDIYVPAGTLAGAIAWNRGAIDRTALHNAAERVGLLDENLLPGGLDARIIDGGGNLSGGQRMRIGIARMLLSDRVVFADEPTAKLDPKTAELVRGALIELAGRRLVIVATHDQDLIAATDRKHVLRLPPQNRAAA